MPAPLLSHTLQGYIGPGKEQVLKVLYLPGVPGIFCKTFQIQVGHLEPEKFTLKGEGSFPRIYLDLPRNIKGKCCPWPQERPLFFSRVVCTAHTKPGSLRGVRPQNLALHLLLGSLAEGPMWLCPKKHPAGLASISVGWKDDGWTEMLGKAVIQSSRAFGRGRFASHCGG